MKVRATADLVEMFKKLLPSGRAFGTVAGSNYEKLIQGLSDENARIDEAIATFVDECFPDTTTELLEDWERVAGLPETWITELGISQSVAERRAALVEKLTRTPNVSEAGMIALALGYGYTVTISYYDALFFTCVSNCIAPLYARGTWQAVFTVTVTGTSEPLLEAIINDRKLAHTVALFEYV